MRNVLYAVEETRGLHEFLVITSFHTVFENAMESANSRDSRGRIHLFQVDAVISPRLELLFGPAALPWA